jgi:hypothetical protein
MIDILSHKNWFVSPYAEKKLHSEATKTIVKKVIEERLKKNNKVDKTKLVLPLANIQMDKTRMLVPKPSPY